MLQRSTFSFLGLTCALSLFTFSVGCGDDGGDAGDEVGETSPETESGEDTTDTETGDTTETTDTTDMGEDTTETTDMGEDTTETTDMGEDTTTETGGECMVWEISYDLEGSEFEISDTPFGAGDQVNTLQEPYDEDENIGPGTMVMRFADVGGAPGGQAALVSYDATLFFVVDGATKVTTDLEASAGPEECGVTSGELDGNDVEWMPSAIVGNHTMGTILCEGFLCGAGGLPDGEPVEQDEMNDQPLSVFSFADDLSSFSMPNTVIAEDDNSTTSWMYMGTETSRELVPGPDCFCN